MKKIAFKNFRRFHDFPLLELGKVSIMVGKNNSGKSTMVKALLLVLDYLQNQQYKEFSFTNQVLEDANIVTFGRAVNNHSKSKEISFQIELGGYFVTMFIYGDNDNTSASVSKLIIFDQNTNTRFFINYNEEIINISKSNSKLELKVEALGDLINEWEELEKEIQNPNFKKTSSDGLRMLDRYNRLNDRVHNYNKTLIKEKENLNSELFNLSFPLKENADENKTEDTVFQEFVSDFIFQNDAEIRKLKDLTVSLADNSTALEEAEDENRRGEILKEIESIEKRINSLLKEDETLENKIQELVDIDNYSNDLTKSIDTFIQLLNKTKIFYLGANPSKQSALFSLRDKQNNLAQAIHEFKQSKILDGEQEYEFVKKWMKEFEVGSNFKIQFYAGEAYEFYVSDADGSNAHLADKGMGSLQAMMLILRVATIIRNHKLNTKNIIIIIEEPELNLHPALQSKLAKFFHSVNNEFGIEFIIETHSEYLIRKTQLLVTKNGYSDNGLNPNPFEIYYFDIEKGPYKMHYRSDGRFIDEFGTGFFDVNSNLVFELP
jgi:predicted ATPase